ncbi:lipase family protein [Corynebacterium auriscanis]|uniref:lipase family protein n=1 Tax=Corynebacterium auriscanis TaxID=99807 RepID=UPI003CF8E16F
MKIQARQSRVLWAALMVPWLALGGVGTVFAEEDAPGSGVASAGSSGAEGAAGSSGAEGSSGSEARVEKGDHDPFYDLVDVSGKRPGDVVKIQDAPYGRVFGSLDYKLPNSVHKIMYTSTTQTGQKVPVTGYVVEPVVKWKGKGPRPTVVVGRGTVGQGDQCAPSRNWPLDNQPNPIASERAVALEGMYDWVFANQGVRVVVTDYVGMGTAGVHTYMNRLDQAHAMIDAARATRNLVEEKDGDFGKVSFYGHSQGGGAAAAAIETIGAYAPELDPAGAYASAPPADLDAVQRNIDGSDLVGAIGFTINGLLERYPELQADLEANLNDRGKVALEDLKTMCTNEITEKYGHQTTSMWTKDGRSLDELLKSMPKAQAAMEAQRIGKSIPAAPVMIVSGRHDLNVEYQQAKDLARKWCAAGASVLYRDDYMAKLGDYNHFVQAISGAEFGIPFILDRFNGVPVKGACQIPEKANPIGSAQGSAEGAVNLSDVAVGSSVLGSS